MKIYVDGGTIGRNDKTSDGIYWSIAVEDEYDTTVYRIKRFNHKLKTNNQAEYCAVMEGLMWIKNNGDNLKSYTIHSDSALVVNSLIGKYSINNKNIVGMYKMVKKELNSLKQSGYDIYIMQTPRNVNVIKLGH